MKDKRFIGASCADDIEIKRAYDLYATEHKEVRRHTKLMQLSLNDYIQTLKRCVHYEGWAYHEAFEGAKKWINICKTKYDKRRKYQEKDWYDWLKTRLEQGLNITGLNIIDIIPYGCDLATLIEFTVDEYDYVFEMMIPHIQKLSVKNYEDLSHGQVSLSYQESAHCWITTYHSYNLADFGEAIHDITINDKYKIHYSKEKLTKNDD